MNETEWHELLHISSSQEEPDTNLTGHEILKQSSSKGSIHFCYGDTYILLVAQAHLYKYEKRIYIIDSHGQYIKNNTKQYYLRRWN